ncbi:hypothetical protein AVEN_129308-1 [Araneus ventricosus]|uniref:Uncharacterized protein n=1 Tax=Araneus ventricosus TaxID=182803 RepID=A0A4Y2QKT2_ARAVE|nr:hypothetical protein AVEN_129308-1 [Araneus ventricosus]
MMSISDYMVESTAYPLHLDHHITDPPIHLYTQRIRRPFICATIIQKMMSWKCPPCGTGILRDFISLTARPIISNKKDTQKMEEKRLKQQRQGVREHKRNYYKETKV